MEHQPRVVVRTDQSEGQRALMEKSPAAGPEGPNVSGAAEMRRFTIIGGASWMKARCFSDGSSGTLTSDCEDDVPHGGVARDLAARECMASPAVQGFNMLCRLPKWHPETPTNADEKSGGGR